MKQTQMLSPVLQLLSPSFLCVKTEKQLLLPLSPEPRVIVLHTGNRAFVKATMKTEQRQDKGKTMLQSFRSHPLRTLNLLLVYKNMTIFYYSNKVVSGSFDFFSVHVYVRMCVHVRVCVFGWKDEPWLPTKRMFPHHCPLGIP